MRDSIERLRSQFARREDAYAGANLEATRSWSAVLWAMGVALTVGLLAVSPPTDEIGEAGWIAAGLIVGGGVAFVVALITGRVSSWDGFLAASYLVLLGLAILQWLAGGLGAPYERLTLLLVLFVAALHPQRRIAVFMGAVLLALASPLLYGGWNADAASSLAATYVIWCVIALAAGMVMAGVREQRVASRHEEAEAREEARRDSLTGVGNRRAFEESLERELAQARRLEIPLSLMLFDIERFKQVNDRWGHLEGDRCLREVAEAVGGQLRRPDLCFRWGGDEFALLLTGTDAQGAEHLGERLRAAVSTSCKRPDGEPVGIHCGTAELREESTAGDLVGMADLALSEAKRAS